LHDLIATITLWDLQTTGARAQRAANGEYRVTLDVQAAKVRSDSAGNDTTIPMHDLVDIGIFAAPENGERLGKPLYLAKHRVRSGRQSITVTVRGTPAHAGIDPFRKLIARHAESLDKEFDVTDVKIE
jgi:ABC-2 type transport system permease protein